ncbi:MAG: hypothetical protein ACI9QD_000764 [Thermoproteota archaeon]|jgi:uncharacterized protein YbjT (DUF2867 family)
MHIAVIGATGLIGSELIKKLSRSHKVDKITTITRSEIELDGLNQIVLKDMSPETIEGLELEADLYFCALGTTIKTAGSKKAFKYVDHDLVLAFAKLAQKSNLKNLMIVSATGANKNSLVFYNRTKGEMESAVLALTLNSVYFLQPSLLIGERKERRAAEAMAISLYKVIPKFLQEKIGTEVSDIIFYIENEMFRLKAGLSRITSF